MLGSGQHTPTILVVDDDRATSDVFHRWLTTEGYRVVVAGTGTEALEAAHAHHPDLILLDLMMPGPSGFDVCAQLKQDPATRQIPVVIVSGLPALPNWRHGCELGAVDYLAKPFKMDHLGACVRKHLHS
jgi:DNA-binding response OmpR family regulator